MTSLQFALKWFRTDTHDSLRHVARPTVPLKLSELPYALHTIPGSLAQVLKLTHAPYIDTNAPMADGTDKRVRCGTGTEEAAARGTMAECHAYNLPLWSSKYGGFGYLPKSVPYPVNHKTQMPLQLIAQINFGELNAQWRKYGKHMEEAATEMLPHPLWPSKGVLAFYADPFDPCYGCEFKACAPQTGYRVLFFEKELEEQVMPLLEQYDEGQQMKSDEPAAVEALEAALSLVMWTREEQYQMFEDACKQHNVDTLQKSGLIPPFANNADISEEERATREEYRKVLWQLPFADFNMKSLGRFGSSPVTCPQLWYADPIKQEYAMCLANPEGTPLSLVPGNSVELMPWLIVPTRAKAEAAGKTAERDKKLWTFDDVEALLEDGVDVESLDPTMDVPFTFQSNMIGGYPSFTQCDPREVRDGAAPGDNDAVDMLLFQIGECSDAMIWGDTGIANFFISQKDLSERRFDRAWFNWDCC